MKQDLGKLLYWSAAAVTFAITVCMLFSCLERSGNGTDHDHKTKAESGTEIGNPALNADFDTEAGDSAPMEEYGYSPSRRSMPDCVELLTENLNSETGSPTMHLNAFDAILFMKQLP